MDDLPLDQGQWRGDDASYVMDLTAQKFSARTAELFSARQAHRTVPCYVSSQA